MHGQMPLHSQGISPMSHRRNVALGYSGLDYSPALSGNRLARSSVGLSLRRRSKREILAAYQVTALSELKINLLDTTHHYIGCYDSFAKCIHIIFTKGKRSRNSQENEIKGKRSDMLHIFYWTERDERCCIRKSVQN